MQGEYTAPEYKKGDFHCSYCGVHANQRWGKVHCTGPFDRSTDCNKWDDCDEHNNCGQCVEVEIDQFKVAMCIYCGEFSIWLDKKLIHPAQITAPRAGDDMPASVSEYYNEAREVSPSSPRAAAALLRIAIKKLCESLGENEPNLNLAIGKLRQKGLSQNVINSLDAVRIIGNEGGAHEGQIDLSGADNKEIVDRLFWLVNFIVEKTITEPAAINNMFSSLPEDKKRGVEQRDKNNDDSATT